MLKKPQNYTKTFIQVDGIFRFSNQKKSLFNDAFNYDSMPYRIKEAICSIN